MKQYFLKRQQRKLYSPYEGCFLIILATVLLWIIFWYLGKLHDVLALLFILMTGVAPTLALLYANKIVVNIAVRLWPAHTEVSFLHRYEERAGDPYSYHVNCLYFQLLSQNVILDIEEKDYIALKKKGSTMLNIYYCIKNPSLFYVLV